MDPAPDPSARRTLAAAATVLAVWFVVVNGVSWVADRVPPVDGGETLECASSRYLGAYRGSECVTWRPARLDLARPSVGLLTGLPLWLALGAATWVWGRGAGGGWPRWTSRAALALAAGAALALVLEGAWVLAEYARNAAFEAGELPAVGASRLWFPAAAALATTAVARQASSVARGTSPA